MVHVERNPPESLRNGRSRGPSPNGHAGGSPDSSDDDSTKNNKGNNKATKAKSEYEEKIRVGKDYQTTCPELVPVNDRRLETLNDRALLVWSPTKDIPDSKLEEYITVAKEKYGYNGEQALGMLFWHKHDLERAVMDLANFTPFPDEWTDEDKVLFEQAFHFHGKSFHRIRQMLPDKNIASLVKYYYSWKKTRSRTSVMDRQEKNKIKEGSENGSENGSNEDSDTEEKKWPLHRGIRRASGSPPPRTSDESSNSVSSSATKQANNNANITSTSSNNNNNNFISGSATNGNAHNKDVSIMAGNDNNQKGNGTSGTNNINHNNIAPASGNSSSFQTTPSDLNTNQTQGCVSCGVPCTQTNSSPHGLLCNSCYHHWSRTGTLRPTSGPGYGKRSRNNNGLERHKSKLPRGMYINHDDIVALACPENIGGQSSNRNDDLLASMDREMSSLLSQIQNNKQIVSSLKRKSSDNLEDLCPTENGPNRIVSRWNLDELMLAVKGVRKFGKDFQAIAELLGTKTDAQVRAFFVNYRRKYNLDAILKEFESENQQQQQQQEQQKQPQPETELQNNKQQSSITTSGSDTNVDGSSKATDDDIMEIDLVDDIPNNKDDDDIEEVSIIEKDSSPVPANPKQSNGTADPSTGTEKNDSISISAVTSSMNNTTTTTATTTTTTTTTSTQQTKAEEQTSQSQQQNPAISPSTPTILSATNSATVASTVSSNVTSTSAALAPTIEPAKAAAV